MVLLFGRLYELRAEEAAEGRAKVVVVGPPCAGKTAFIKQFLEPRGVEAAEETAGLAPGGAAGESLVQRLRRRVWGRYVRGDEVKEELDGVGGADFLKAFDKLPRDFVEYLKERYGGWSLYLFYIPPDAEHEEAKRLRAVMEEVGVEFRWFGLSYMLPGLAKALAEKGEDYVRRQLKLYKELAEELDIAEGRLRKAAKSALENLLGQAKEIAERLIDVAAPGAGVAVSILTEVLTALLFSRGGRGELVKLVAGLVELDEALRCILAARLALALGLDKGAVEKALATLAGADVEKLAEEVKALKNAADRLWVEVKSTKRGVDVLFLEDVEMGGLYENFVVLNERPYVDLQEGLFPLAAGGRFEEEARRVLEKLERDGVAVLVGPKGIGKSTLAAYVVWKMLSSGEAEVAVRVEKSANELTLKRTLDFVKRKTVVLYDPSPLEVYYKRKYMEEAERPEEVVKTLEELADFLQSGGGVVRLLVVLPTDLYEGVKDKMPGAFKNAVLEIKLNNVEFLHSVIKTYSSCEGDYSKLAEEIAQLDGGYTLAAKYAGLWLRDNGCNAGDVERAVEETKKEPKVFFAHYIWHVLLRGSSDLARRVAVPLLLHAVFGTVPVGVTYVTKAVYHGVWRFLKPEELEGVGLESLREEALEPIAKWLAQRHEDLVEEALRDLAGLNGEEARKPYKKALGDIIKALDWARGEVLKEGAETLAKLGVPEEGRISAVALLAFVVRRLAAVFKSGEVRGCWRRAAFIAGFALAEYLVLPTTKPPEHVAEVLGDVSEPCAVDDYLAIDGVMSPLSIGVAQLMSIRELNMLTPYTDAEIIKATKKTAERLLARWRRGDITLAEAIYALGLAALAAGGEVDGETADRLLYAASSAVQWVAHPRAVLPVLAALRSLGEKAPHNYVSLLATVSELRTLDPETVWYIYDALQQLRSRLLEAERLWPLVEVVAAYSNLLRKYSAYIWDRRGEAVADMCRLYGEIRRRSAATAPGSGLSAHRLFDTTARARVLAVALESDDLARHVQRYCGIGDFEREVEAVRSVLDEAAAHPDELSEIAKSDADYAEWVERRSVTGNAGGVVENVSAWFKYVLARYKLAHALDEKGELDKKKLEEAAEEFEKAAEINRKLKQLENYLSARGLALGARILAAKSWGELLERAKGFWELWKETEKHPDLIAEYLATAAGRLSEYLVYLAASGDKEMAEELLKEWRWLLDYRPEVSVATRLMLRLLGVGEGAKLEEVVDVFESLILPEFRPAISMLAGRLQRDRALEECAKLFEAELCHIIAAAAAGNRVAAERLRSVTEKLVPETSLLLDKVDGKTLVVVQAPMRSEAQLAFMLLAAVEGRVDAVRLHGLIGSAKFKEPLPRRLFRAVYENCSDLDSEGCRMALLKLYYLHY
jgi:Mrp family chromosome partitioning ATPase